VASVRSHIESFDDVVNLESSIGTTFNPLVEGALKTSADMVVVKKPS
jgi:hypothetical protein